MNGEAQLRIGSLEILAALALFGLIASRLRPQAQPPAAQALQVRLRVRESTAVSGENRDLAILLAPDAPKFIGRSRDSDVAVGDPEVSRRHARLDLVRGYLYLSDLGSSNGTFLNGKPVKHEGIEVRPGDDIDVGTSRISVIGTEPASWT